MTRRKVFRRRPAIGAAPVVGAWKLLPNTNDLLGRLADIAEVGPASEGFQLKPFKLI
jgi:hypothetical protein